MHGASRDSLPQLRLAPPLPSVRCRLWLSSSCLVAEPRARSLATPLTAAPAGASAALAGSRGLGQAGAAWRQRGASVGTVVEFDDAKGWGTVRDADGVETWFHCTAVTDGSRTIPTGAPVTYEVVAGRRGQWEASGVRPS